jgi:hypothetical protein
MLTPQRVVQLDREGHITKAGRSRYPLEASVHGYLKFMKRTIEGQTKSASSDRAQDARAREIELRMAREDRKIIDIAGAAAVLDRVTGEFGLAYLAPAKAA